MKKVSQKATLIMVMLLFVLGAAHFTTAEMDGDLTAEQELAKDLHTILQDERLDHAVAGVHVRSAESGVELFSFNGGTSLVPASGQKLLAGAAALDRLGPEHTFNTEVLTNGEQRGAVLQGDLFIKGEGDPTILPADYEQMAGEIAEMGIKNIHGNIVADDTYFDDMRLSLDLSWFNQRRHTGAQVSALSFAPDASLLSDAALDRYNTASVYIEIHPGENPGDPAKVQVTPETDAITIRNDIETVESGGTRAFDWGREHGTNEIFFEGTLPVDGARITQYVAVWEPTEVVLNLFNQALEENGVQVHGDLTLGETPSNAQALTSHHSMSLTEMMYPYMKLSQNNHSEHLTKTIGKEVLGEGTWNNGLSVVEEYLERAGVDTSTVQLRDGSGMSHLNKIPPREMTQLLFDVQTEDWFDLYYDSLPVAGMDDHMEGGTLRLRMRGTAAEGNAHAKTGTITSKTSLSGYVKTKDDEQLAFSIILNNFIGSSPTSVEDAIVVRLAEFSRGLE
ncbi:D-alanyl-D-alanine carboxypeptidase/D-alanyl-D-alanine-endopeptidase [Bacillus sp. H-16]|uniref:D-alanyl-D-alanine carboxypeptidase/D-alanyl-D-alanine endopeptidase n=1 Tax=Alteribacter salitolerans TaxID=2912333 RepID=UPI001962F913|nr:D-alanyl-D-alanine carboxypeptidase/D-alanyl-D-alanine-endopeptidase [Alteribacter salitolerans]MBM7094282.1 D-alanyl-D-alanine carboxypeptidase/D-alanyl-D-alanine-endopeptidase [Alteribacter salitolerans]